MKNTGFTYVEIMVAITIFLLMSALVVRLNITSNKNINMQVKRQNLMLEAQKCLEEYKNNPENYHNNSEDHVTLTESTENHLSKITITDNSSGEIILISHFFK
ncbi:type II secretion system protein [Clostridium sp. BJN0013]|uniref:type II secretion system protein n=1 Tax=Clostridium sp. BJN0013 TaxID=3236840 RepID=UPI0034C658D7